MMAALADFLTYLLSLLPVIAVGIYLAAALALQVLARLPLPKRVSWLTAVGSSLAAWLMILLSVIRLPHFIPWLLSETDVAYAIAPVFVFHEISWAYALALATVVLSVFLTARSRGEEQQPALWTGELLLAAVGVLAVTADTPLALVMVWAAVDGLELGLTLTQVKEAETRRQVVYAFAFRTLGILVVLWQMAFSRTSALTLSMFDLTPGMNLYFLLAAALRLGVVPLHNPFLQEVPVRRGFGTLARLVMAGSALAVLGRVADSTLPEVLLPYLLALAGISALVGAVQWAFAADELAGRSTWVLSMASLSFAAAVRSQTQASLAWGLALLLPASMLYVVSRRDRRWAWLPVFGFLALSGLPFSPLWYGTAIYNTAGLFSGYSLPSVGLMAAAGLMMLAAQGFLLAGFVRHAFNNRSAVQDFDMWGSLGYFVGVFLLAAVHFALSGWMALNGSRGVWVLNMVGLALAAGIVFYQSPPAWKVRFIRRRKPVEESGAIVVAAEMDAIMRKPPFLLAGVQAALGGVVRFVGQIVRQGKAVFSLAWLYMAFFRVFDLLRRFYNLLSRMMEGQGGVLWALLLFMLLIAFIFQSPGGR